MKVALATQSDSYAFLSDEDFLRELKSRDVYSMRNCFYLLDRLENHGYNEVTDTSSYSIEHILPQNENLPKAWRDMLGPEWRSIHSTWVHRLGNLTLTGYNSTYSDRPFEEKKSIDGGFAQSPVRLNGWVGQQEKWTASEIEERGNDLAARALTIWSNLDVPESEVRAEWVRLLKQAADAGNVNAVPMTEEARNLFETLRRKIKDLDPSVIEMAKTRSVSYHAPGFFLEVIPRKRKLSLLLPLDFSEVEDTHEIARDATEYSFIMYATYDGGVLMWIENESDVEDAMPIIRQAFRLAPDAPIIL